MKTLTKILALTLFVSFAISCAVARKTKITVTKQIPIITRHEVIKPDSSREITITTKIVTVKDEVEASKETPLGLGKSVEVSELTSHRGVVGLVAEPEAKARLINALAGIVEEDPVNGQLFLGQYAISVTNAINDDRGNWGFDMHQGQRGLSVRNLTPKDLEKLKDPILLESYLQTLGFSTQRR